MSSTHLYSRNNMINWFKVFLPHSRIKFYPPVFNIRNPIMTTVKVNFKKGYEVAVLSFYIKNYRDLSEKIGKSGLQNYFKILKEEFKSCMSSSFKEDVLILHDYQSEGVTAIIRLHPSKHSLDELDQKSDRVECCLENKMQKIYPDIHSSFNSGYMFIDKSHQDLSEAIGKAHHLAFEMAEKKVQSKYNQMLYEMSQIVANKEIRLLVQPIIDVSSNESVAYEVLTRGPKGRFLESPLNLFSFARQTGMLYELEMIVFEQALIQLTKMKPKQNIFINFTPISVGDKNFFSDVRRLFSKYPSVSPTQLVIEITERDAIDELEHFIHNIKKLREYGLRIAVDDTGAGYASLHTIIEIIPDIIKIDRSVIQNIDGNSIKESMLKGLLLIAKEIGSTVVAEGIESEQEAMILSKNKVDLAQGYFYARPYNIETATIASPV